MKIGILTFHDADNCGAVLQAYALTESIKKIKKESKVEIINYKMPFILNTYRIIRLNTMNIYLLIKTFLSSLVYLKVRVIKKSKFKMFRKRYMSISKKIYKQKPAKDEYDSYIVGSDQVWNSDITGYEKIFFLDFCDSNSRKISYAASIGKNILNRKDVEFIKQHINNFDFISVREDTAADIIRNYTNKKVFRVLDPTFLLDKNTWMNLIDDDKIGIEDYILLYMVSINEEALKVADIISKKLNLPVLYINDSYRKNKYGFKHVRSVGPIDFLKLIKGAKFVVTSSFHGTAFSIIFNKKFFTVPYKETSSRMIDLLKLLNLESRIIENSNELKNHDNYNIDYYITNQILESEREKSLKFLRHALDN